MTSEQQQKIAQYLQNLGEDLGQTTNEKLLHIASKHGDLEIVEILIKQGSDINAVDENNENGLIHACRQGNIETCKFLVDKGSNINLQNSAGLTALMETTYFGNLDIALYLVKIGADVHLKNNDGNSILHVASSRPINSFKELVQLLISEKNMDINELNNNKSNAFMTACRSGNLEICELFIKKGIDINLKNEAGETGLEMASEVGANDLVNLLIQHGAIRN